MGGKTRAIQANIHTSNILMVIAVEIPLNPTVQQLLPYSWHSKHSVIYGCLYAYFMALLQPCNFSSFGKICIISEINNITDS